jgi:hypothetical protein
MGLHDRAIYALLSPSASPPPSPASAPPSVSAPSVIVMPLTVASRVPAGVARSEKARDAPAPSTIVRRVPAPSRLIVPAVSIPDSPALSV